MESWTPGFLLLPSSGRRPRGLSARKPSTPDHPSPACGHSRVGDPRLPKVGQVNGSPIAAAAPLPSRNQVWERKWRKPRGRREVNSPSKEKTECSPQKDPLGAHAGGMTAEAPDQAEGILGYTGGSQNCWKAAPGLVLPYPHSCKL